MITAWSAQSNNNNNNNILCKHFKCAAIKIFLKQPSCCSELLILLRLFYLFFWQHRRIHREIEGHKALMHLASTATPFSRALRLLGRDSIWPYSFAGRAAGTYAGSLAFPLIGNSVSTQSVIRLQHRVPDTCRLCLCLHFYGPNLTQNSLLIALGSRSQTWTARSL